MDYEQKYENLVGKIKRAYMNAQTDSTKAALEHILPELKESEDERTRKEILNVFKQLGKDTTLCGRNYDYAKWIAWLEKQGETYTKKDVDDAYLKGVCDAKQELEKQGEKKLANSAKTCKKSQRMISAEAKEALYDKSAWSEEEEVKINRIVAYLENLNVADNDILLKDVDWLKSLKDRKENKL